MSSLRSMLIVFFVATTGYADNPIIQTKYTADPAPMVYEDTVYLYTGHDEDDAQGFKMLDWMLYTSTDMVNWTDHGVIASLKTFNNWSGDNGAWASQCVARNGKFYLYCTVAQRSGTNAIGVAESDSPFGPFRDAIGKPLVANSPADIDPTVFVDDDGQAYMYWGNPNCYYVKLNPDMISYSGDIIKIDSRPPDYQEGPWLYKRDGLYYLSYASTCCPEGIGYAMSKSPTGSWAHKGKIMDPDVASSGNHPGIIDYKGNSYVFGFNYELLFAIQPDHAERRSICVERLTFNADGTIPKVPWWSKEGAPQIETLNPYARTEAETICWTSGVETEPGSSVDMQVCDIDHGDYIKVKGVDFGDAGAGTFTARVASGSHGGTIELHLDRKDGPMIGSVPISYTGDWEHWKSVVAGVSPAQGTHDLFLVFKGDGPGNLFNFDFWQFSQRSAAHELVAIVASVVPHKIDTSAGRNVSRLQVMAVYADGTSSDVTTQADVSAAPHEVVAVRDRVVTGLGFGSASINVSYGGKSDQVKVLVKDLKAEGTVNQIRIEPTDIKIFSDTQLSFTATAEYMDGHTENVTAIADYTTAHPEVALVEDGVITAERAGKTTIAVTFRGPFGDPVTTQINLDVSDRDPYVQNKASDFNEQYGVRTEDCSEGLKNVGFIENGDWLKFTAVDFDSGAASFEARVASAGSGGRIEIVLDSLSGPVIGTCEVEVSGGWQKWVTKTCSISGARGKHDIYLRFVGTGGYLLNVNWWQFHRALGSAPTSK